MRDSNMPVLMGIVSFFSLVFGLSYSFELQEEKARAVFNRVSERPELCGTGAQPRNSRRLCGAVLELRGAAHEIAGLGLLEQDRAVFERIVQDGIRRDLARAAGISGRGLSGGSVEETAVSLLTARANSLRATKRTVSVQIRAMAADDRSRAILDSMHWL